MSDIRVKNIVSAPLFSRTFAALLDLLITIFIGSAIFLGISNIAYNVKWIKAYKDDYNATVVASGLMQEENKELVPFEYEDYELYQDKFYHFYHDFYSQYSDINYDIYWFNVHIYGQEDTLQRYDQKDLNNISTLVKNIGPTYFTYKLDNDHKPLVNEFAVPLASQNGEKGLSEVDKVKLRQYFYVADADVSDNPIASKYRYIYYYALADLTSLSQLQKDYNYYAFFGTTLPLVISIIVTFMIFYFVVPLFFKNGETIGKLIMHICLVNKLGYQYRKVQLIPRFLFPTFLIVGVVFILGFSMWSLMVVSGGLIISYGFVIFSKNNKAIHDFFAGTMVIDARASTWFTSAKEEEKTEQEVAQYVADIQSTDHVMNDENIIYTNPHSKEQK